MVTGFPEGDESRRRLWLVEVIPEDTSALHSPTLPASDADATALVPASELFPDRAHVRLRNREDGLYIFADEDGVGVSMSSHRATLNTVWGVHQVQRHGTTYTLLHSAAYGRYLAYSAEPPPTGSLVQNRYYHDEAQTDTDILWEMFSEALGSTVMLRHGSGRHGLWEIKPVPLRPRPPLLPEPSQTVSSRASSFLILAF